MDADVPLHVEVLDAVDGVAVVRVGGELDIHTAPLLTEAVEQAFADATTHSLEIDAERLQFCDSSGIQVLVKAREQALERGGGVRMVNLQGAVSKVLAVTGLLELFS
jgi:anti-anti-sigma factor